MRLHAEALALNVATLDSALKSYVLHDPTLERLQVSECDDILGFRFVWENNPVSLATTIR